MSMLQKKDKKEIYQYLYKQKEDAWCDMKSVLKVLDIYTIINLRVGEKPKFYTATDSLFPGLAIFGKYASLGAA